jgi:hypothetical protein
MKKLAISSILSITLLLLVSFFSCVPASSTQETKEIPYITINTITDVLNANFDELTDLYGMGESSGDNEIPKIPEIDITGVTACDDSQNIRFDIYHSNPITLKDDVFYGLVQYWKDGFDIYFYFPMNQELYINLYNSKGKVINSYNLDLEKAKVTLIPWSLSQDKPVNIVSLIFNKELHWGIKPGNISNLIVRFVAGVYIKDKGIYYSDMTPTVKIEFNH